MKKLVLWDIDHTLIETGEVGSEVFHDAFEQVTSRKIDKLADVTGRTEPVIFRETLEMYGIDDPGDYFPKFVDAQAEGYRTRADEMRQRGRILPGACEALETLAALSQITQSVLTGNPQPSAIVKLSIFGLTDFADLEIGAYETDDSARPNLIRVAQERAKKRLGAIFTKETRMIVGDTVSDVDTALKGGAQIIAGASGNTTEDQLRDAGAAVTLANLTDVDALLRALAD